MDLILWRHAEAIEDAPAGDDLERPLTPRGERDATRVAAWLDRQLPEGARILSSPALRCCQTASALGRKFTRSPELSPGAEPDRVLQLVRWPDNRRPVLIVGHQPDLGRLIALLLGIEAGTCPVRKGGVWWLRSRDREQEKQTVVVAVLPPEMA